MSGNKKHKKIAPRGLSPEIGSPEEESPGTLADFLMCDVDVSVALLGTLQMDLDRVQRELKGIQKIMRSLSSNVYELRREELASPSPDHDEAVRRWKVWEAEQR